ncbi:SdpI family protein [Alkalihalobacillus pseudalcaliphilus]|uniref:SdpI family protein n=1 Tax=Alkalihalobacillus pseudalcaliphilus TaxID=79884 RepID=UPI00064D86D1|nr:SdpI family protein [Alkalihalobacillus pseudalcaliphilus]KMK75896.1 hypothetical protein AB990_11605 [Alkalihalobacillus pseudalcaliphilus]
MENGWVAFYCLVLGAIFIGVGYPLWKRKVAPNELYGFRFKRTLESEEVWYDVNEHGGRNFFFYGTATFLAGIVVLFFPPLSEVSILIWLHVPIFLILFACLHTYVCMKKEYE